jgi:hypothetical protein
MNVVDEANSTFILLSVPSAVKYRKRIIANAINIRVAIPKYILLSLPINF